MTSFNLLFYFLRYIQPTWYQNLRADSNIPYWVDYRKLDNEDKAIIMLDDHYSSEDGTLRDASYQAWQKGVMHEDPSLAMSQPFLRLPLADEYRFVRKYFHPLWSWYVLMIRLLTFRNPIIEIYFFLRNIRVGRVNVFHNSRLRRGYKQFQSSLIAQAPLVSVIIPTLNRQIYLKDALLDLTTQSYKNFEVIIVDQNEKLDHAFYSGWPLTMQVVHQSEKALWKARNTAVEMAKGAFLLLFDDDSRVDPDWIEQHLKCLDYFKCQLSAGVSISVVGANVPENYSYFRWADQLDTGNVMIRRQVFEMIGLFDRQFERQRMGDGEYGLRSYLAGFKSVSNPYAKRLHLKVETGGLRQMGSWDGFRPTNWFAPRPIPSVLYLSRTYFGTKLSIFDLLVKTPPSIMPFRYKRKPYVLLFGSVATIFIMPFVLLQVYRSWKMASSMITQGPMIRKLILSK